MTILNEKEPRSWTLSAVSKDAVASQCSPPLEWCCRKEAKDGRAIGFFMSGVREGKTSGAYSCERGALRDVVAGMTEDGQVPHLF